MNSYYHGPKKTDGFIEARESYSRNSNGIPGFSHNRLNAADKNLTETDALRPESARWLSSATKSQPVMDSVSPRWLLKLLPWVPVESGVYRVNRIKRGAGETHESQVLTDFRNTAGENISQTFPDYDDAPREYMLSVIQTILRLNTHVTDLFNVPFGQRDEQVRLAIEAMRERQEWEIINDPGIGLLNSVTRSMRIRPRKGVPSPDDMDELMAKVWKKPAFFLAHPRAIAAVLRECTRRGVPPTTVNLYGSPFILWRGIPIIPCDKLLIDGLKNNDAPYGKTNILLLRAGEKDQGVIGLHQPGIPDECEVESLSIRPAGIDNRGISSYILSLYFSVAVLSGDALGLLEDVEIGNYYDYK